MKILILFLCSLFLLPVVHATTIGVNIEDTISGQAKFLAPKSTVLDVSAELLNDGSVGYKSRERVDIFDGDSLVYTGWSAEQIIQPGERALFPLYWHSKKTGTYNAVIKFYFAHEIYRAAEMNVTIAQAPEKDVFSIAGVQVDDKTIRLEVSSTESIENVRIIPQSPPGWIVEQATIDHLNAGEAKEVLIPYEAGIYVDREIPISLFSADGTRFHEENIILRKSEGVERYTNLFWNFIFRLFHSSR